MRRILILLTLLILLAGPASAKGRFAWGAEIGTGIDMGSDDMSSLNLGAYVGCSAPWISLAAVGVGIDNYMSHSWTSYPVYALIRTSFSPKPRLLFGELRAGLSVNQVNGMSDATGLYLRPGIGFQLATGKKFRSYLMLSYLYNSISFPSPKRETTIHGLNQAVITLGISF